MACKECGKKHCDCTGGETGPTGPSGPQGSPGSTGLAPAHEWSAKSLRFKNPDGSNGTYTDLEGPAGPAGTGSVGPVGPQGPQGPVGAQGSSGAAGPQGLQGNPGNTGPPGPAGNNGALGISRWMDGGGFEITHDIPGAGTDMSVVNLNSDTVDREVSVTFIVPSSGKILVGVDFTLITDGTPDTLNLAFHSDTTDTDTPLSGINEAMFYDGTFPDATYKYQDVSWEINLSLNSVLYPPGSSQTLYLFAKSDAAGLQIAAQQQAFSLGGSVSIQRPKPLTIIVNSGNDMQINNPALP